MERINEKMNDWLMMKKLIQSSIKKEIIDDHRWYKVIQLFVL